MTPIFEGHPSKNKAFSNQNKVIWVSGWFQVYKNKEIYIYICD